jgi:hypothetical protein
MFSFLRLFFLSFCLYFPSFLLFPVIFSFLCVLIISVSIILFYLLPYSCLFICCLFLCFLPCVSQPSSHCPFIAVHFYFDYRTTNNSVYVHLRLSVLAAVLVVLRTAHCDSQRNTTDTHCV